MKPYYVERFVCSSSSYNSPLLYSTLSSLPIPLSTKTKRLEIAKLSIVFTSPNHIKPNFETISISFSLWSNELFFSNNALCPNSRNDLNFLHCPSSRKPDYEMISISIILSLITNYTLSFSTSFNNGTVSQQRACRHAFLHASQLLTLRSLCGSAASRERTISIEVVKFLCRFMIRFEEQLVGKL